MSQFNDLFKKHIKSLTYNFANKTTFCYFTWIEISFRLFSCRFILIIADGFQYICSEALWIKAICVQSRLVRLALGEWYITDALQLLNIMLQCHGRLVVYFNKPTVFWQYTKMSSEKKKDKCKCKLINKIICVVGSVRWIVK